MLAAVEFLISSTSLLVALRISFLKSRYDNSPCLILSRLTSHKAVVSTSTISVTLNARANAIPVLVG